MTKSEFLNVLKYRLRRLPQTEVDKSINFYIESIDDRVEDGMTEEQAVANLGEIEQIAQAIELELPFTTLVTSKIRENKQRSGNKTLWVVLAVCGSPLWLPVALALAAAVLMVWIAIWMVVAALYLTAGCLLAAGAMGVVAGFVRCFVVDPINGLMLIGIAVGTAGLFLLVITPINLLCKQLAHISVLFIKAVKGLFVQKGEAQ